MPKVLIGRIIGLVVREVLAGVLYRVYSAVIAIRCSAPRKRGKIERWDIEFVSGLEACVI